MRRSIFVVVPMLLAVAWVFGGALQLSVGGGKGFGRGKIIQPPPPPPTPELSHSPEDDDKLVASAGLSTEGPGLVEFFKARARTEIEPGKIEELIRRLSGTSQADRIQAGAELVAAGPLAVPGLRRVVNDLESPEVRELAKRCLALIDGPMSTHLSSAAARLIADRRPAGAAEALLAYLPFADNDEVLKEISIALKAVGVTDGKADPALVKALSDPLPLRRAFAGAALSASPSEHQAVEKLLQDTNPEVRMSVALSLAKAHNGAAVQVLIDLIAVLPPVKRGEVEEILTELAGEWAPQGGPTGEDEIARKIRRDTWAAWWANADGPALTALLAKHTLTPSQTEEVKDAIRRLGDKVYQVREKAVVELIGRGRRILPMLREALKEGNELEVVRRAQRCIDRIEQEPANRLPAATLRLLALRKPDNAAGTLLAYIPFAEEEYQDQLKVALAAVALRDGKPDPAMMRALSDSYTGTRAGAAEALAQNGGAEARPAVRKLLEDDNLTVRLRTALALAPRDAKAIPVLIDLMTKMGAEPTGTIHDFLTPLAGDKAPTPPEDSVAGRKKCAADWADWWKENGEKTDVAKLTRPSSAYTLGYTVVCEHNTGKIVELDRNRKPRWSFGGTNSPVDAWVLPNNRVIVAEYSGSRATCRDMKGNLLWAKQMNGSPHNIQALPNGHTFIASNVQIAEVDRNGKDVKVPNVQQIINNTLGTISGGYKTKNGQYILMGNNGQCLRIDAEGKQIKSFNTGVGNAWMDVTPQGKIILAQNGGNSFKEYDFEGKLLHERTLNNISISMVTGLPNGNFLVSSHSQGIVQEMDRNGKALWEYRTQGPFRSRGR